jgi:hypothetical protein
VSYSSNDVSRMLLGAALAAMAMTSACTDQTAPSRSPGAASHAASANPRGPRVRGRGIEDVFLDIEDTIPGFGGFFKDSEGNVNVYVRDSVQRGKALGAVNKWLRDKRPDAFTGAQTAKVVLRQGRFGFSELVDWQGQIGANAVVADKIGMIDADESRNRVRIFVKTSAGLTRIAQLAARLGIPQDALVVEVRDVHVTFTSANLRTSTFRPLPGGIQIVRPFSQTEDDDCTYGFSVRVNGQERWLTASHCTGDFTGGAIGQYWYQPTEPFNVFGYIVQNPAWAQLGCPNGGFWCNSADVALGAFQPGVHGDFKVAETQVIGTGNNPGNLTVANYWTMNDWYTNRMMGDAVYKTGRTTGTTTGPIASTCTTTAPDDTYGAVVVCAHWAQMFSGNGDSGAPVYYLQIPDAPDRRRPEGVLFGGGSDGVDHFILYSSIDKIQLLLGVTLDFHHL